MTDYPWEPPLNGTAARLAACLRRLPDPRGGGLTSDGPMAVPRGTGTDASAADLRVTVTLL